MRVLFTTRGSAGHVLPLAPFGHAARRAGHEVLVVAQRQHEAHVARTGLAHAPVDDPDPDEWRRRLPEVAQMNVEAANIMMVSDFFGRMDTTAALPRLRTLVADWRPDVIVRESWEYASTLVADLEGIPLVRVALGLSSLDAWSTELVAPILDALRADLGLPADPAGNRLRATPLLTMLPSALEEDAPHVRRYRAADAVLTADERAPLPDWWAGSRAPLVYLTLGSVAGSPHMPYFPALYRRAIDALASLPIRLLVTLGDGPDPEALGATPANVHVARWVPQDAVLPHAAAVVHHGGYGSTLRAPSHGVPSVVLPLFSIDQWANADAVQRAGARRARPADRATRRVMALRGDATFAGLHDAVRAMLGAPASRRRAGEIAAGIAGLPPVDEAVALLAQLANGAGQTQPR